MDNIVPCNGCRLCCINDAIILHPEQGDDILKYKTVEIRHPMTGEKTYMLEHKPNGDCIYLGKKGCENYENRPLICRTYDCRKQYLSLTRAHRQTLVDKGWGCKKKFDAGKERINTLPQTERKKI